VKYQWMKDVNVEGRQFRAGDVIGQADIPAGSFKSCLRLGWLAAYTEPPAPPPQPARAPAVKHEPEPPAKPKADEPRLGHFPAEPGDEPARPARHEARHDQGFGDESPPRGKAAKK
jgi:hypothetical protein